MFQAAPRRSLNACIAYLLFYINYKAFEVFSLRVVDVYRVVGRLCQLMEYAHVALGHCCGCEDCGAEVFLAYSL